MGGLSACMGKISPAEIKKCINRPESLQAVVSVRGENTRFSIFKSSRIQLMAVVHSKKLALRSKPGQRRILLEVKKWKNVIVISRLILGMFFIRNLLDKTFFREKNKLLLSHYKSSISFQMRENFHFQNAKSEIFHLNKEGRIFQIPIVNGKMKVFRHKNVAVYKI